MTDLELDFDGFEVSSDGINKIRFFLPEDRMFVYLTKEKAIQLRDWIESWLIETQE